MTADDETTCEQPRRQKKSLLQKYDIPVSHLDFDYIKKCCNILEIERIVKILRSNEEGYYPELLECALDQLKRLYPESKLLRLLEPVMTKESLEQTEWDSVVSEIEEWKQDARSLEKKINKSKILQSSSTIAYPEIRTPKVDQDSSEEAGDKREDKQKRITDYQVWDTFDADKECLKLDLEEEMAKEERLRKELEEKKMAEEAKRMSLEEKEISEIAPSVEGMSEEERQIHAVKEKDLGNEFYKTNRLETAIRHYTRSIYLHPTATAYNNRAATYLKQCSFTKALHDLNIVLELEPENVKAHYRRALTYQHKNEFYKALDDINEVLKREPKHVLARHVADQLRENCASLPKKHKLKMWDENDPTRPIITEVTEEEMLRDYQDKKFVEVNDHGLPKIMCNCNGKYTNDPGIRHHDELRYQHIRSRYRQEESRKEESCKVLDELHKPSTSGSFGKKKIVETEKEKSDKTTPKRLEIIELEKIEEEDYTSSKQLKTLKNSKLDSELEVSRNPTTCLVTDMRKKDKDVEIPQKTYFGGYKEDVEKGSFVQTFSNGIGEGDVTLKKTKEEKISLNTNLRDYGLGEGDAGISEVCNEQVSAGPTESDSKIPNSNSYNGFVNEFESDDEDLPLVIDVDVEQIEKALEETDLEYISKIVFPNEEMKKCECGEGFKIRPLQFQKKWSSVKNQSDAVDIRGNLMRLICPHQLHSVIGNNLDEEMLGGFIRSLSEHFDSKVDSPLILEFLKAISNLERFSIIYCFLAPDEKQAIADLLKRLHPTDPNLEKAFS